MRAETAAKAIRGKLSTLEAAVTIQAEEAEKRRKALNEQVAELIDDPEPDRTYTTAYRTNEDGRFTEIPPEIRKRIARYLIYRWTDAFITGTRKDDDPRDVKSFQSAINEIQETHSTLSMVFPTAVLDDLVSETREHLRETVREVIGVGS